MNEQPSGRRRVLVTLIIGLAIVQTGILIYLGFFVLPRLSPTGPVPTAQAPQFELPSAGRTVSPGDQETPQEEEDVQVVVGPLVAGTDLVDAARLFDVEQAFEHILYLTSDESGGRQPGTPGGYAAGDYVAERFEEYGLQPAGPDGTYFQSFEVPYGRVTDMPVLEVIPPAGEVLTRNYAYRTDYRAVTRYYFGGGQGEGQVLWLSECGADEYAGQDAVGKIVLCRYSEDLELYRQAIEHRVGGILLLDRDSEVRQFRLGSYREPLWVRETIPAFQISERVAEDLLVGSGYTLDELSLRFVPTTLSTTVRMAVVAEEQEQVEARNVLGLLPGSDPEHSDEVVIIGAHIDHLGTDPDGVVHPGANDNASGVATVLEIARLWAEQDYRPARSVLFAAWDGEEQGLLGSRHYVQNPTIPLTLTVGNYTLDMVGSGSPLQIDGEGFIASQMAASAEVFGITTTVTARGRSDHVSFTEAGIPGALYIRWPDELYHYPEDSAETLDLDKLREVGVATAHALSALAQGHVEVEEAVERFRAAIAAGDRDAFLESIDPQDSALQAAQVAWFDNLWSRELTEVSIDPSQIRVGDAEASVRLRLAYRWANAAGGPSVSYDVRFVRRDGIWHFGGYELESVVGDALTVFGFADIPGGVGLLITDTQSTYVSVASGLGVDPVTTTRVIYYPNASTMRTIARPAADRDDRWLVSSAELAEIAWNQPLTPALVTLTLNQMGLPLGEAAWLREGLAIHFGGESPEAYLAAVAASGEITDVFEYDELDLYSPAEVEVIRAHSWTAAEYLLERYGPGGLRDLCAAWGELGNAEDAFQQALGLSLDEFESMWRASSIEPIRDVAGAIEATLADRVAAVMAGDEAAFMDTVVASDSALRTEERNWFEHVLDHPVISYDTVGQLVEWSPGEVEAVVELSVDWVSETGEQFGISYDARFVREEGQWLYAGVDWEEVSDGDFTIKYLNHDSSWSRQVLESTAEAYDRLVADFGAAAPLPLEIKIYQDRDVYRALIDLSLPDASSWSALGESIRLYSVGENERLLQELIARELARKALLAQGLRSEWLRTGVATYAAGRVSALGTHWQSGDLTSVVQDAVRRQNEVDLERLPVTAEELQEIEPNLANAQLWSLVSFVVERYGIDGLHNLIAQTIESGEAATSLRLSLGVDPDAFWEEWRDYVYAGGAPQDLIDIARQFDAQRAIRHIAELSGPDYGGREAGTEGAVAAAEYIAERFSDLGLEPLGDPLTATGESGYLQWFPVLHTHLISTPVLALFDAEGELLLEFEYRQDFVDTAGAGNAQGELVWLQAETLEGLHFGGAVVLEEDIEDPLGRAAELQSRGAGGLVVVTDLDADDLQMSAGWSAAAVEAPIPVVEITEAAFEALLEQLGMRRRDLSFALPAMPLGAQMQQAIARSPITVALSANVVGLIPGSDPSLSDEFLLVGAHYDHIGRLPDGQYFPGANRNASGVAAMLEMVEVWRETAFNPGRSVLFVVWGAEEVAATSEDLVESPGLARYLADPPVSLEQTVGVFSVDSVGAGEGYRLLFYGTRERDQPLVWQIEAGAAQMERRAWRRGSTGDGWHAVFGEAGIPVVKLQWDRAEEGFYRISDTVESIDPEKMSTCGEVLTLAVAWLSGR